MPVFDVQFSSYPTSISVAGVVVQEISADTEQQQLRVQQGLQTMQTAVAKLNTLEQMVAASLANFQNHLGEIAVELSRLVLGSDNELIEIRLQEFLARAFDEMRPILPERIYVHPTCKDVVLDWLRASEHASLNGEALKIVEDRNVAVGDCRLETGETGISATLEAFLETARIRLSSSNEEPH